MTHRLLAAIRREPVDCTPVWFMRQAGRYQAEYREIRKRHSILEICDTPELSAEASLIPIRLFPEIDAAIIFSDLLIVPRAMGIEVAFEEGEGPVIRNPIRTEADIDALIPPDPAGAYKPVLDAIRIVKRGLKGRHPLIGFAGAPFTLASYLIEGGSSRHYEKTKTLMMSEPRIWEKLMTRLAEASAIALKAQVAAGADVVQIFDSWVGSVSADDYKAHVLPYSRIIFGAMKGVAPAIHFGTDTAAILELMQQAGGDVIGVDWRIPLDAAGSRLGSVAIQGNLDPVALFAPRMELMRRVDDVLEKAANRPGHIFNLGHGILPATSPDSVAAIIERVHSRTRRAK